MTNSPEIDWQELLKRAREAAANAYAPYSDFPVGAAGLTDDGTIITGCNVENASYRLTLCAECGVVSHLHQRGGGRLIAVVASNPEGTKLLPCGGCRQILHEAGGDGLMVDTESGARPLGELLVDAFGPEHLDERKG